MPSGIPSLTTPAAPFPLPLPDGADKNEKKGATVHSLRAQPPATDWQRLFVRDLLYAGTDGKLHLCERESELPEALPLSIGTAEATVIAAAAGTLSEVRGAVREAALHCGLDDERAHDFVIAAGEAAMNAVVHANGGICLISGDPEAGRVQVRVIDSGRGIDTEILPRAVLEPGFTTSGTLGQGFTLMQACADRIWLRTGPQGTTIVLEQSRITPHPGRPSG